MYIGSGVIANQARSGRVQPGMDREHVSTTFCRSISKSGKRIVEAIVDLSLPQKGPRTPYAYGGHTMSKAI